MATSRTEVQTWDRGRAGRARGFAPLDWLSQMGIGLLSVFADPQDSPGGGSPQGGGSSSGNKADAYTGDSPGGGTIEDDKCCFLARTDNECAYAGGKVNYTCPEGFHRSWWFCVEGTQLVGCGECSTGESCWEGPWECSIWWWAAC